MKTALDLLEWLTSLSEDELRLPLYRQDFEYTEAEVRSFSIEEPTNDFGGKFPARAVLWTKQ